MIHEMVCLPVGEVSFEGWLALPKRPQGIVLFALGTSASRHCERLQAITGTLHDAGLGAFLVDLLTPDEDRHYARRYDIPFLADRLQTLTRRFRASLAETDLRIGYFSASTGAAAALWAAADPDQDIAAVASCEGRPDLVEDLLPEVTAPTLLMAGANSGAVTRLNVEAYSRIGAPKDMVVIPGPANPMEEPRALGIVVEQAIRWFQHYLPGDPR